MRLRVRLGKTTVTLNTMVDLSRDEWSVSREGDVRILNYDKLSFIHKMMLEIDNNIKENALRLANTEVSPDELKSIATGCRASMNFFSFFYEFVKSSDIKGLKNYKTAINKFKTFCGRDNLSFDQIDKPLLTGFCNSMSKLKRAQSMYLAALKHIWNNAEERYGDIIPRSPFVGLKIPKQKSVGQRAIPESIIRRIYEYQGTGRAQLARDCFILSLCLCGMNAADLYSCKIYSGGFIIYERQKTKDRREDNAHMEVAVHPFIKDIIKRYKGTGSYVFNFHKRYSDHDGFTKALNTGLKIILGKTTPVTFYSARHSWATIARNKCGASKYDVNEGLAHKDPDMDVTDLYILKDYGPMNNLNKQVIEAIFPEAKDMK